MAFIKRHIRKVYDLPFNTTGGFVQGWAYGTPDAAATVVAAGYFNDLRDRLKVNDTISVMAAADATGDWLMLKVTAVPASGDITTAVNSHASGS